MHKLLYLSVALLFAGLSFGQPIDILVNWKCNMEFEILSGRFTVGETVAARGDFNGWGMYDLIVDPVDPNFYISEFPILIPQVDVGDTIVYYKYFYTPNTWETGADRLYILTQDDYNAGEATISRAFNDATLETVTNQETTIQFTVDCNNATSFINGLPFPVINTCHIAGGIYPLQWPSLVWPNNEIGLMIPMYDDGINGNDPIAGDLIFNASVIFPPYTVFSIQYKYGINYGDDANNGGGNDNEAGAGDDHFIELSRYMESATVENVFGTMGFHDLINIVIIPVELTSFTANLLEDQVVLNWQTATETNNLGFEIQRKIIQEGSEGEWIIIGFKEGAGTTTEPQQYLYYDDVGGIQAPSFSYRLKQIDLDGSYEFSDEVFVENFSTPDEYYLSQNYPNPFNPSTKIEFKLPQKSFISLKVFDILGNEVATLVNAEKPAGAHSIDFNASELTSGIYLFTLKALPTGRQAGSFVETRKMILMK